MRKGDHGGRSSATPLTWIAVGLGALLLAAAALAFLMPRTENPAQHARPEAADKDGQNAPQPSPAVRPAAADKTGKREAPVVNGPSSTPKETVKPEPGPKTRVDDQPVAPKDTVPDNLAASNDVPKTDEPDPARTESPKPQPVDAPDFQPVLDNLQANVSARLREMKFQEATKLIEEIRKAYASADWAKAMKDETEWVNRSHEAFKLFVRRVNTHGMDGALKLSDREIGRISSADEKGVTVKMAGAEVGRAWKQIPGDSLVDLARRTMCGGVDERAAAVTLAVGWEEPLAATELLEELGRVQPATKTELDSKGFGVRLSSCYRRRIDKELSAAAKLVGDGSNTQVSDALKAVEAAYAERPEWASFRGRADGLWARIRTPVAAPAPVANENKPKEANAANLPQGWSVVSGTWKMEHGTIFGECENGRGAIRLNPGTPDYLISCRIRLVAGKEGEVVARVASPTSGSSGFGPGPRPRSNPSSGVTEDSDPRGYAIALRPDRLHYQIRETSCGVPLWDSDGWNVSQRQRSATNGYQAAAWQQVTIWVKGNRASLLWSGDGNALENTAVKIENGPVEIGVRGKIEVRDLQVRKLSN